MEQLGYFKSVANLPLYGVFHPSQSNSPKTPVLIAPGLFEERKSAYAALKRLACRLASAGHPVLRFDYRGSGESGGESRLRRWADLAEDLDAARDELERLSARQDLILLGLRLGGTLVLQHAQKRPCTAVMALAPVIDGAAQVRQWKMRSKIRTELTAQVQSASGALTPTTEQIDFDGFEVHPKFFEEVAQIDLHHALSPCPQPALLLQISHRTTPSDDFQKLAAVWGETATLQCLRLEPFWEKVDDVATGPVEEVILSAMPH